MISVRSNNQRWKKYFFTQSGCKDLDITKLEFPLQKCIRRLTFLYLLFYSPLCPGLKRLAKPENLINDIQIST